MERGQLPTKQDLKSVKGKEQDDVVMALTQAIGPDEAIKLLEQCDMSKHAAKLVPNKKGNPDGPLPKWGEPEGVEDAMKKTPGQKKVKEACWDGYKNVGMKKKGKKRVPNCVPEEKEVKTIKVGEDAVGSDNCHYALVMDRKVTAVGTKDEMLAKCKEEGGRVWVSTKKVGDVVEERSAQDPDIKDRKGTQPAAYHKGLKKTTKAKRDAHFKKHGKKADDDASAYQDAPGDKKARKGDMPKSKYTKFVDKMMDEEHEIHVRLDHLDGDSRQKKAGAVMRKHERAGHIEYVGNTDKGVVFKAKSKSHADRLHRDLKPHATGVEHMNEGMSPESQKAHRNMFKAAQKKKDDSAAQAEREKRLKAKGWVKNDRGGMSKVSEAKYAVDIEGMPRFYMDSDSPARVKIALRQMLKKASAVKSVTRTYDTNIKADLRQRLKDASTDMHTNLVGESDEVHARFMRAHGKKASGHGRWAFTTSRHGQSQPGQTFVHTGHFGDAHKKAKKHFGKPVYVMEKLKASDDMGKWVDDFKDSDAPQFKGKSMKKRRQMAIAAKLSAMRESTEAYGKSVNKMADDKKKAGISASDKNKLGKLADMMKKERKEETQIDELSKKTLGSYVKKATKSAVGATRDIATGNKPDDAHRISNKRAKGINTAVNKLTKEDIDYMKSNQHPLDRSDAHHTQASFHTQEAAKAKKAGDNVAHGQHKNAARHHTAAGDAWERHHAKVKKGMNVSPPHQMSKVAHSSTQNAAGMNEEKQKKDHQTISYVTHGGQKGKVQVHKDNAFKALNHYRKNNKSAQFEETGSWKKDSGWRKAPAERKDEYGNTIKKQNIAKHLARKAMKSMEKKS